MLKRLPIPLLISAFGLLVLPPLLLALGLTMTSATEVVVYAIACMALNILVGHTGLVSFGHGAWFGLAAYAAALMQRNWMHDSFFGPTIAGVLFVAVVAAAFGFLILRRRGVYFSLLTLALAAMLYAVSFRWTEVTGGENGLGGITRPTLLGFNLESSTVYYWFVAGIAMLVLMLLWRFHNSTVGSVLVAIRENEQRARFLGYPTNRYKLAAFVLSASITGLAGILLLYQNRMTSADPISVSFSGDLLAMVVIGGMRSFLGPALGALFFILFREFLGIYTENWLFWFGLVFVGFIVFSPTLSAGNRLVIWNERPMPACAISSGVSPAIGLPSSETAPSSGGYMPDNRLNAVVLPAPLGPISACRVRSAIEMSMPCTARMPPKLLTIWRAVSTAPSTWDFGRRNSGSGSTSIRRADIAASSTVFLRNGASSRSPTPTRPVGENTMKATNTRPNQNSQFSV